MCEVAVWSNFPRAGDAQQQGLVVRYIIDDVLQRGC